MEELNNISSETTADTKRQAQVMYFSGYKIAEISRQLDIPASTIASWKDSLLLGLNWH